MFSLLGSSFVSFFWRGVCSFGGCNKLIIIVIIIIIIIIIIIFFCKHTKGCEANNQQTHGYGSNSSSPQGIGRQGFGP